MFERTLTICSAGKTFSVTGWKIGWIIGPEVNKTIFKISKTFSKKGFNI